MSDDFIDPNPALDDSLIMRLQYDLAAKIHPKETIALRYGFNGVPGLFRYLSRHPQIVENVKKARALLYSDAGSEERVRLKALMATEDLIPAAAGIASDPRVAAQQRIDAFKQLSRVAAVDGSAAAAAQKAANGGAAFTLNILFRDKPEALNFTAENVTSDPPEVSRNFAQPELLRNNGVDEGGEADLEDV